MEIATFILSLAGALAWTPFLYDKLMKKPEVKARLIGLTTSPSFTYSTMNHFSGSTENLKGIGYFPKFIFISLIKDFNVSNVEVAVKYPGESELRKGTIFFSSKANIKFEDGVTKTLTIPSEEHIGSLITLKNNKPTSMFIPFCIEKPVHEHFESIRITFTEFDGTKIDILLNKNDIDVKQLMFEERYWI